MWTCLLRLTIALLTFSFGVGFTNLVSSSPQAQVFNSAKNAAIISELLAVEKDLHVARIENDRTTLERLLADDFINIDQFGRQTNKSGYIGFVMKERFARESYTTGVPTLVSGDDETVTIEIDKIWWDQQSGTVHFRDIDTFTRQNGHWQMLASDSVTFPFWVE
ncbi:MAG: nuclear transport factor 2 family protein [Pyrinomonadaceae bacterium]